LLEQGHVPGQGAADAGRDAARAPRSAILMAHPGHELRIHGWIEQTRPLAFVLTDGSGSCGASRLDSTTRVLDAAGARPGPVYGRHPDKRLYDALLERDASFVHKLAEEILDAVLVERIGLLAADAIEGFNPVHDLCRHLADAVAARARLEGHAVASYAFLLAGAPAAAPADVADDAPLHLALDDDAFARKLSAADGYPELDAEVRHALTTYGRDGFRDEWLWPIVAPAPPVAPDAESTIYERWGDYRRRTGVYPEVVRRREHVEPLARVLRRFGEGG